MPTPSEQVPARAKARDELLQVAVEQFATIGYAGTSLQQIADAAGYSKSSVLYHFTSKEAILEAAIGPAIDRLEQILSDVGALGGTPKERRAFVERFIDFLFTYRLEVHTFINQGQSLVDVPVIRRANELIIQISQARSTGITSMDDRVRFGVALGGAAYTLVATANFGDTAEDAGLRSALIDVVSRLLGPVRPHQQRDGAALTSPVRPSAVEHRAHTDASESTTGSES